MPPAGLRLVRVLDRPRAAVLVLRVAFGLGAALALLAVLAIAAQFGDEAPSPPDYPARGNALRPGYSASAPSSSSIRSSWLYLATRSVREGAPVLIWPAPVATTRSEMVVSSVSPERWEITTEYPFARASSIVASASVSVPIWFTLTRMEFATPSSIPRWRRSTFVTNRSSPTSCSRSPSFWVIDFQAPHSSSARPSSIDTIG